MPIDRKKFYESDRREYVIKENEEFLMWLLANIEKGYTPPLNLREMQRIIGTIKTWYEFKYPMNRLTPMEGIENAFFVTDYVSDSMTILALKYRLTPKERRLLDCEFRMGSRDEDKNLIEFSVLEKFSNTRHHISLDAKTGLLKNGDLEFLDLFKDVRDAISIVEIYHTLKEHSNYDIEELKSIHLHHKIDLKLRRRIFDLINLALIYSKDVTPELGLKRAKMFSREFSRYFHIDIEPPELESLPMEKESRKITDTVKMMRLVGKIDTKLSKRE